MWDPSVIFRLLLDVALHDLYVHGRLFQLVVRGDFEE
jgi:hypothetical protein